MSRTHPTPPVDPRRLNGGGDTAWTNLGWWPGAGDYPAAAAALARRVGAAAALRPGDAVVDYACGYGDSLRMWVEQFGVRRVTGVEPDPRVAAAVERRIAAWGLADRIRVVTAHAESLAPGAADAEVSAVVCVDAAYHFAPRTAWLAMVARALPAGGRLAWCDLVVQAHPVSRMMRLMAPMMRIPPENLVSEDDLRSTLASLGMAVSAHEAAGTAVLDGFAAQRTRAGMAVAVTRAAVRLLRRRGPTMAAVDYCVIGAAKR